MRKRKKLANEDRNSELIGLPCFAGHYSKVSSALILLCDVVQYQPKFIKDATAGNIEHQKRNKNLESSSSS